MPLWKNTDEAASAPKHTVDIVTGNTGVEAYQVEPVGTWGVDTDEAQTKNVNGHAGWVLRTVGEGGRAGRVIEETLVAMGSMGADGDADDDAAYPDATITIVTQPQDAEVEANSNATFTVVATVVPNQALEYQWYNVAGDTEIVGANTATLILENVQEDDSGNAFYVIVSAGDASVESDSAELTVVEPEEE
jgi:hypothetical protein